MKNNYPVIALGRNKTFTARDFLRLAELMGRADYDIFYAKNEDSGDYVFALMNETFSSDASDEEMLEYAKVLVEFISAQKEGSPSGVAVIGDVETYVFNAGSTEED